MEPRRPRNPTSPRADPLPAAKRKRTLLPASGGTDVVSNGVSKGATSRFDWPKRNVSGFNSDIEVIDLDPVGPSSATRASNCAKGSSVPSLNVVPPSVNIVGNEVINLDDDPKIPATQLIGPSFSNTPVPSAFFHPSNYSRDSVPAVPHSSTPLRLNYHVPPEQPSLPSHQNTLQENATSQIHTPPTQTSSPTPAPTSNQDCQLTSQGPLPNATVPTSLQPSQKTIHSARIASSADDAMLSKVYIGREGGLFRVNENTIEIIDSDDEDQLVQSSSLVCCSYGGAGNGPHSSAANAAMNSTNTFSLTPSFAMPTSGTVMSGTHTSVETAACPNNNMQPLSTPVPQILSSLSPHPFAVQPIWSNIRPLAPTSRPIVPNPVTTPGASQVPATLSRIDGSGSGLTVNDFQTLAKQNFHTADAEKEAATPSEMTVQLMPHQRRALEWMSKRERPTDIDEVVAIDDECLGGILADEQGLGKTLSMIAVMLKNQPKVESHSGVSMINGRPLSDDEAEDSGEGREESSFQGRRVPWRTLVVCPLSLLDQWHNEIVSNIWEDDRPSVCVYHGQKRNRESSSLKSYDVVITTYSTLVSEYPRVRKDLEENKLRKLANLDLIRRPPGPLFQVHWRRAVLDEAHNIKNRSTGSFSASMFLKADVRWCLTGTPITNSVDDIYSLFCFVRYSFVPDYETWNQRWKKRLEHPSNGVRSSAFKQFQALCGVVVLRRTKKDTIDGKPIIVLPKRNLNTRVEQFRDKEEIMVYNTVQEQSVVTLDRFLNGSTTGLYSSMLVVLLRLRQACCHPFLVQYSRILGNGGSGMERRFATPYNDEELAVSFELAEGGDSLLELFEETVRERIERLLQPPEKTGTQAIIWRGFVCAGCRKESEWACGVFFGCGDLYCEPCSNLAKCQQQCFRCNRSVKQGDFEVSANGVRSEVHAKTILGSNELGGLRLGGQEVRRWAREELARRKYERNRDQSLGAMSGILDIGDGGVVCNDVMEKQRKKVISLLSQSSTKIRIILEELAMTRQNGQNDKTLIFSQWTSMLDIVEFHVELQGHETCRLDGTMSGPERNKELEEFKNSETKNVLLVSLHAGGTGLNLTAASRVILCDVWWNPSVEHQAIDRVHRIGQTRDVYVTRFRMEGTVEDRIYTICASKLERVNGALGQCSAQSLGRRQLTMNQLMSLFSGTAEAVVNRAQSGSAARAAATNLLNYSRHNVNGDSRV